MDLPAVVRWPCYDDEAGTRRRDAADRPADSAAAVPLYIPRHSGRRQSG